jgi:hypothetical protein
MMTIYQAKPELVSRAAAGLAMAIDASRTSKVYRVSRLPPGDTFGEHGEAFFRKINERRD